MFITDNQLSRNSNNFDFIRLFAASLVLIGHASVLLLGRISPYDPFQFLFGIPMHTFGVNLFFILSGFLIASSWEKSKNLIDFSAARILRIFPAVIVLILISVFFIGMLLTHLSISEYLNSELTGKYLQNMTLFRMYYYLPGVFTETGNDGSVNGSLWTLPYEFTCYMFLAGFGLLKMNNKINYLILFLFFLLLFLFFPEKINTIIIPVIGIDFFHFFPLFLYFSAGILFYLYRKQIVFGSSGIILCVIGIVCIRFELFHEINYVFIISYLLFYFSFSHKIPLNQFGKYGDYSYGFYLYAYPVQQIILQVTEADIRLDIFIFLSMILTLPLAILSWHLIEKPAVSLRKKIFR